MPDDFSKWLAAQSAGGTGQRDVKVRTVGASVARSAAPDSRLISFQFSDQSVARDGHTIATDGWDLANFLANPVFLWCHESSNPPVGKVVSIGAQGSRLCGDVEFADAETYPFADTIFRLYKGGFLNACSVSWLPISWAYSSDKARAGGIDFKRQEMLEISAVPVPAAPTALATARTAGIDTGPLYEWAERVLDGGDRILIPRSEVEQLRRAAKMPVFRNKRGADDAVANDQAEFDAVKQQVVDGVDAIIGHLCDDIENDDHYDADQRIDAIAAVKTVGEIAKAAYSETEIQQNRKRFNEDQPRDENGKFASGGGSSSSSGDSESSSEPLTKQQRMQKAVDKLAKGTALVMAGHIALAIARAAAGTAEGAVVGGPVGAVVGMALFSGATTMVSACTDIAHVAIDHFIDPGAHKDAFKQWAFEAGQNMEQRVADAFGFGDGGSNGRKAAMAGKRNIAANGSAGAAKLPKRGLYEVSWLASILSELGYVKAWTDDEAAWEGDGSKVPAMLQEALKQLGAALVAMTEEEVAELLASFDAPGQEGAEETVEMRAAGLRRAAFRRLRRLDPAALSAVNSAMAAHLRGETVAFSRAKAAPVAFKRAGKVLSSESASRLEEIHGAAESCRAMLRAFIDEACGAPQDDTQDTDDTNADDAEARALRARRARARRHAFTAA
ncbi:hypothetical protein QM467_04715 [Rhodoblastus sp. 17X3]|uniref:hypothetical protein n=1 Tax=Rhodoblastus sp. 17X3 TaxID=3047026 RepID=UPI0024B7A857|nr:hypothetical protein [Rhodoblastus sp. 17X3]MDI9847362.1 hypothetical protein [Rhodoblastus sp. 17X3]